MGGYGSGGHNRTHESVESYSRIDSYGLYTYLHCDDYLKFNTDVTMPVQDGHITYNLATKQCTICMDRKNIPLELSQVPNMDGKTKRLYFLCPYCGKRVRYLYRKHSGYMCRMCAGLNYRSQQKSGLTEIVIKMERIVEKDLRYTYWRKDYPDSYIQDLPYIPKPNYMSYEKYNAAIRKFRKLQEEYHRIYTNTIIRIFHYSGTDAGGVP